MVYKLPVAPVLHYTLTIAGTAAATIGVLQDDTPLAICGIAAVVIAVILAVLSRRAMRERCWLIIEAARNKDYSFRLPRHGFSGGELFLQEALNSIGAMLGEQHRQTEQQERFYGEIMSNITTGIIVLDKEGNILKTNAQAARIFGLPQLTSLHQLDRDGQRTSQQIAALHPGRSLNITYRSRLRQEQLLLSASQATLDNDRVTIIAVNDIRAELDAKELDTWVKLTRVLTHEIMNSVAPIASLSETLLQRTASADPKIHKGIQAIHDTSAGLVSFVDSYRKFSSLQQPSPATFSVSSLIDSLLELDIIPPAIQLTTDISPRTLTLTADPNLIRQALLNVVKNAVQAIDTTPGGRILITARATPDSGAVILISNNGPAIPADAADKIFMPFFTTRCDGNGIGLALSMQIMKLSSGTISLVRSNPPGMNVTFALEFFP